MTASATTVAARLQTIVGASHVLDQPADCTAYAVDEIAPSIVVLPESAEEVAEVVRFAAADKLALIPCGARTKLAMGMPPARYDIALDMARIDQIAHYDPGDLTLSVDAGMPVAKLNAALAEHGQFLPLLVPYYAQSTAGGTLASGVDSPLRQFYGTARDFVIGAEFVTGEGKLSKSGGRVVKNVTGYDLHKLLIGSLGTLAVITRVNFRTFPAPPASRGFVASFSSAEGASELRRRIAESPLTPLTLDVLSPELAQIFATRTPREKEPPFFRARGQEPADGTLPLPGEWFHAQDWQLCAGFGGTPEVLERYARELARHAQDSGATSTCVLDDTTRPSVWGRLRESLPMLIEASATTVILWVSLLPIQHTSAIARLREIAAHASVPCALVVRATGTIYFALLPEAKNENVMAQLRHSAEAVVEFADTIGGHATILFCPAELKRTVNVWGKPRVDLALMQRVKKTFDPAGILAPGRFLGGI